MYYLAKLFMSRRNLIKKFPAGASLTFKDIIVSSMHMFPMCISPFPPCIYRMSVLPVTFCHFIRIIAWCTRLGFLFFFNWYGAIEISIIMITVIGYQTVIRESSWVVELPNVRLHLNYLHPVNTVLCSLSAFGFFFLLLR